LVETLGLNLLPLNFEPDGTFPKGPPDPLLAENRTEIEALTRSSNVDFGVAWDADADRFMFFDEQETLFPVLILLRCCGIFLLEKYGTDNKIIFDPRVIWPALKVTEGEGAPAIISKGGHSLHERSDAP